MIGNGANVNYFAQDNVTPLHLATEKNHSDIVKILLEHNADGCNPFTIHSVFFFYIMHFSIFFSLLSEC